MSDEAKRIIKTISEERLSRFVEVAKVNGSHDLEERAIELYMRNLRVSKEFYELIHLFEVTFRNFIHYAMSKKYGDGWLDTYGFRSREKAKIIEAKERIGGKKYTQGKLISELNLGFWFILFERANEKKFLFDIVSDIFPALKRKDRRIKDLRVKLSSVVEVRNRVAHHEPLINIIGDLRTTLTDIVFLINGMEPYLIEKREDVQRCISELEEKIDFLEKTNPGDM